jgi:hypothetical protein
MTNLSRLTDLYELVTSSLIRGIQMGEISRLGWLIGLVKHAIWVDSLYFLYLMLLSIPKILAYIFIECASRMRYKSIGICGSVT